MAFIHRTFCFPSHGRSVTGLLATLFGLCISGPGYAQEVEPTLPSFAQQLDIVWILVAAALVMMMQIGFMLLEAGMVRSKNSINVAQKNLLDFVFSVLVFAGFGFMFAFGASQYLPFGIDGNLFMLSDIDPWTSAFFVFQVMFCGTAATIVSGAVAERMRLPAYVLGSIGMAALIYPAMVHWAWGTALGPSEGAFLANMGFVDFAGSTVVHATGAWVALAACLILGPRLGRFSINGKPVRIAGHSPVLATSGALLLFFGWIGFNGGSTVAATRDIAHIILNTVLAGATGAAVGYLLGWWQDKVIFPEKAIVGMLGGLVAVTAGCMVLETSGAVLVGLFGAAAAIGGNWVLEHKFKIDDAVNAIGTHGVAGAAGTLLLAILAPQENLPAGNWLDQLGIQALGVGVNFVWAFGAGLVLFLTLDAFFKVRVSTKHEERGLNEAEHATRLGIGHVEEALDGLVSGTVNLNTRLRIDPGDESEQLTRTFNALMDNLQHEEVVRAQADDQRRNDEEAERLTALTDAAFEALCISVDGKVVDGNGSLETLLGYSLDELRGNPVFDYITPEDHPTIRDRLKNNASKPGEATLLGKDGSLIPVELRGRNILYRGMRARVSAIVDLRDRKKAEAQIRFLAQHDPLTNLPNRALFNEKLDDMVRETIETGTQSAVIMVDLDHFKDINDLHGHPAGDEVIKVTGERLRAIVREDDMVARLGGDEFAVLQGRVAFANQAEDLAHRIVTELVRPIKVAEGTTIRVGASVGVAVCPRDGLQGAQLVTRADTALYHAKNSGRNQYALFEPGMDAELRHRQMLDADLLPGLENEEFQLYFQPRLDIASGRIGGYEALIRWIHPERGLVNPGEFIPAAERSGKILPIGTWVLREACRLGMTDIDEVTVSVNVSPIQFRDKQFVELVASALDESGLPASRLEIEITESVLIDDDKRAVAVLKDLKKLGIRIALDDFGTGYSSLAYLSRFPFDTIKIDRSFLQNVRADDDALAIVDTIIRLGRALEMTIVAEGVEHLEEVELLAARGCHEIQGFVLGKPMPHTELLRTIPAQIAAVLSQVNGVKRTDIAKLRKVVGTLQQRGAQSRSRKRKVS